MRSGLTRLFGKVLPLREGEATTALLMFAYSFLAMTSYNILKPVTRSKFISDLGADNLPYVQLVAGILIGAMMAAYSRAVVVVPRRWVIPITQAGQVALLVGFWLLFRTNAEWGSAALYLFGQVLGILLISQFWTLANDIYDARRAKRLFGLIGGGASLGGATGAAVTSFTVGEVGTDNLLLVSASVLAACALLVTAIGRRERITGDLAGAGVEEGVGGGEAVRMLRTSKHLQMIALVIGFAALGAVIVEQQLNMAAETSKGAAETDAITGFLAQVTLYLSLIGFVVQVALTSRIHRTMGLGFALLILPVSLGATATVILLNGALWAPAVARVLDASLRYTVDKTTREVLFLPLPVELNYRAKPFVDVTVDRFAKGVGALLLLVLIKPWGLGLGWQSLSYVSLGITGFWIAMAMKARREYLTRFRKSIETGAIAPGAVRIDVADTATIETLVEELANPDDSRVLYAIEMLDALDKRNLITPLLMHHESPKVRARALAAVESASQAVAKRWLPAVERMLKDENASVRAAALRALTGLSAEEASIVVRRYLDDPEPRVAVTAAAALADSASAADREAAEATFRRLAEDTRETSSAGRREAAAALGRVGNPALRSLLVPLMSDSNLDVAHEAIRSVQAVPIEPVFVPVLISLLGHRVLKTAARDVLVRGGEGVLDALEYFLNDPDENAWVRRHIPATIALIPSQRSMDILVEALDDPDGFLRFKVVAALEKLRGDHPRLVLAQAPIESLVLRESSRYYNHLTLRFNVVQREKQPGESLLVRALDDKLERTLDRIYRLLGLIYGSRDVATARHAIENGDPRTRAGAIEFLDNLLKGIVRKRVMPILDDTSMAEKVRQANIVLRSRPRDLEDTVAQLVHDDDQVVAAAAIQFVEQRQLWTLADDLEFALAHRSAQDWYVFEAASWALASRRLSARVRGDLWNEALPAVELADRMRRIPLFDFVSIDELFRIAGSSRQVRYEARRELYREGTPVEGTQFLLDGSVQLTGADVVPCTLESPAALGFEEMLEGGLMRHTVHAADRAVCLALGRSEFLTMLSDNVMLAQGLCRMLLDAPNMRQWRTMYAPMTHAEPLTGRSGPLQPLDKVMLLRQNPLLARATVSQLLELAGITREVPLVLGNTLFTATDPPAVYYVLDGEIRLECDGADPVLAAAGCTVGASETLAGVPLGRRATVTRAGQALRLDQEELFATLGDHIDLLQGLFSGLLKARYSETPRDAPGLLERASAV